VKNSIIEISKKKGKSGRTPIRMILHEIHTDESLYNKNGITWVKDYCEQNLESVKGMPLVAQFLDEDRTIPYGGHGNMVVEENKVIFEDSLVVGSFEEGIIVEGIEVNGKTIDAVVGIGYVYDQRFPKLVEYLQEEHDAGNPVEGSVEICADQSKGNTKIVYDGGWKEHGRKPQVFEYSGHALIIGQTPADDSALMLELNSYLGKAGDKQDMKVLVKQTSIEINKLSFDDIATLVTRAFNAAMGIKTDGCYYYDSEYYIHKFYPVSSEVIMRRWKDPGEYFMTTYKVENAVVTIGDIVKVEENWSPVSGASTVEVNALKIKETIDKPKEGGNSLVGVEELNAKIAELSKKLSDLGAEKDDKIAELNELLVNANKSLTEANNKKNELEVECNGYKEELNKIEAQKKQAEVNAYFDSEIPKNNFEANEVESLKGYVEKCDLDGLKKAEAELIVQKFKANATKPVETNTADKNTNLFFATKVEKIDDVEAGKSLFNK